MFSSWFRGTGEPVEDVEDKSKDKGQKGEGVGEGVPAPLAPLRAGDITGQMVVDNLWKELESYVGKEQLAAYVDKVPVPAKEFFRSREQVLMAVVALMALWILWGIMAPTPCKCSSASGAWSQGYQAAMKSMGKKGKGRG